MNFPLYIQIVHKQTGQVWSASGWRALVVLLAFVALLGMLDYVFVRVVQELLNRG